MTGYQSKKTAALDEDGMYLVHHTDHSEVVLNMAQPAQEQELTLNEQLDKAYAKWSKAGADLFKAYAEIKRIRVTCIINDGINTPELLKEKNKLRS